MRVVEYDPSRRADVADLMGLVWGERPDEEELAWFYEQNPVRPASVLLAEEDGKTVATAAISFVRMSIGGESLEVGMPLRVATDPAYRGRGIFAELEARNEERVRELGIRLLLTVPNAASAPVFLEPARLEAAAAAAGLGAPASPPRAAARRRGSSGSAPAGSRTRRARDRVLRDAAWLNWRFADSPTRVHAARGRGLRGRGPPRAATASWRPSRASSCATPRRRSGARVVIAAPPPWQHRRYIFGGYVPTHRTFTVLGKALASGQAVPERPHFELGDLDFL